MTLGEEASRSIQGAWGLLRRDPGAPTAFNATLDGFWRSFFAGVVFLPLYLAYRAYLGPTPETELVAPATRWSVDILVYVIGWAAWPLIAFYVARALGRTDRLIGYVVAYNWSQLLTGPFMIGLELFVRMALPDQLAAFVGFAGLVAVLGYEYMIARQMLALGARQALLVVLASFILVLVLRDCTNLAMKLATPVVS
ncbi:MAG: hypothetical protein KIT16_20225 [Rhodospirillaceae bacterium]|nr:hypothetical protein [Rhodospirillaceae bacterium]